MASSGNHEHESESVDVGAGSSTNVVRKILTTSREPTLWCHFDLCEMTTGEKKARCKACGSFLAASGNTNLRNHVGKYCKALREQASSDQAQMSRDGGIWSFDAEMVRQRMTQFVIQEALSFDHFDNPRLTKLIRETLQPRYTHVSRSTLRRDAFKLWKKAKKEIIIGFQNLKTGVNLTSDVWSAPHGLPEAYICFTAHWIDPDTWQMMKRTIAFESFAYPHRGEDIYGIIDKTIQIYKLEDKVCSISFDNAANNTAAIDMLKIKYPPMCGGAFFHTRCAAHIINLVVQDGLKVEPVAEIIDAFRVMLRDVFSGGKKRFMEYRKWCHNLGQRAYGPNWDVVTRWNSTWKMFDSALKQRETLQLFHDTLVNKGLCDAFEPINWEFIKQFKELLEVFKTATTLFSGVYYPTSPQVLFNLWLIGCKLNAFEFGSNMNEAMVLPMKEKLRKYFKEMPPVISCAAMLNPTLNANGVRVLLARICADLNMDDEEPNYATKMINAFDTQLNNLFEFYLNKYGGSSSTTIHESFSTSSSSKQNEKINIWNTLMNENTKRARGSTPNSELGRYMGTPFNDTMSPDDLDNLDLLAWWKARESQFPVLAAMARDLLSVQASTVASESVFSLSGRVLSLRRTRLTPDAMEVCICLKDYLDGVDRVQHLTKLEGETELEEHVYNDEVDKGIAQPLSDDELAYDESVRSSPELQP